MPVSRDLTFYFYPVKAHLAGAIRSGQIPWLDPYRWGGVALLGAPGAAAFYPGNLLFVLLPLGIAMKAWILLHVALAVAGFAAFSRRLGLAPEWAAVAGLGFALGGASVSLSPFPSSFSALALLPWFAAAVLDLVKAPTGRSVVKLALAAALLLLSGIPEFVLFAALVAAALVVPALVVRPLLLAGAAALLAGALAAPQLLPSVATALGSSRGPGGGMNDAAAGEKSLPSARLVELLGDGLVADWTKVAAAPGVPEYPYLPSITPGRVVLLLALVGLAAGGRGRLAALSLASLGIALAMGPASPVWQAASGTIPFFGSLRFPEKNLVLTAFGAAWLAALGLGALARKVPRQGKGVAALLALAILVDREPVARRLLETDPGSCLTEPPSSLRPFLPSAGPSASPPGPPPRLFHFDSWAPVPRFDTADLLAAGRAARASLDPSYASLFGVAYVFEPDYDVALPREAAEWNRLLSRTAPVSPGMTLRMARAAGAAVVLQSVRENGRFVPVLRPLRDPLPPYRFVNRVVSDPDGLQLFKRFLDEEADPLAAWVVRAGKPEAEVVPRGEVLSVRDRADGLFLEVEVKERDGYLLLFRLRAAAEEATLDGRPVVVEDATFGFTGVAVPPGRHLLRFRPPVGPVRWGLGAAAIGALACAALWTRRQGPPSEPPTDGAT